MPRSWSASDARANFSTLLDDAAAGQILQIDRQRDGAAFILVSKQLFMASRPNLAQYLAELDTGLTDDEAEEWLEVMRTAQGK